jgi:hypothetical protein
MPFTKVQIDKAIKERVVGGMEIYLENNLTAHINYSVVVDYLTGNHVSLNELQPASQNNDWITLLNLLNDRGLELPYHQLVFDILRHPAMQSNYTQFIDFWLAHYALRFSDSTNFDLVLNQLYGAGNSDNDIFELFIEYRGEIPDVHVGISDSPLRSYLLRHLPKTIRHAKITVTGFSFTYSWSIIYFILLDLTNPQNALEYAIDGLINSPEQIGYICYYQNGKYLPGVINYINNQKEDSLEGIAAKFALAFNLYTIDGANAGLLHEVSAVYLEKYLGLGQRPFWEQNLDLPDLSIPGQRYIPLSACAIHFMIGFDKENTIKKINEWLNEKVLLTYEMLYVLFFHMKEKVFPIIESAMKADLKKVSAEFLLKTIALLTENFAAEKYLPLIWNLTSTKSRQVRERVVTVLLENDGAVEEKAITLMAGKNAEGRQAAVSILGRLSTKTAKAAVQNALDIETNEVVRDLLLEAGSTEINLAVSFRFIEDMISAAGRRGRLSKPLETWLEEDQLPPLSRIDGTILHKDWIRFLFYRMSRTKTMQPDPEARYILQVIDVKKSSSFALALIDRYTQHDSKAELKWILTLAALLGNEGIVDKLRAAINKWIDEGRYKMAEYGVGALALQGSDRALRIVEWYSRKYQNKKANVGAAASAALEIAAVELGISVYELGDRIVPDFGFEGLFKSFDINGAVYRAFIDSNFKIAFFDEDNRKIKSLPAGAPQEIKEELKSIAKEVRDITKSQSSRLEYYLIIQRRWSFAKWQQFFLNNPVMFIYATKLLWGVFDNDNKLLAIFRCDEDTTLLDIDDEEIVIDESHSIAMVYPTQLSKETLTNWNERFYKLRIEPIFPQLNRKLPDLSNIDLKRKIITQFEGRPMKTESIRSTLEKCGWQKGPTGDGGMVESFRLANDLLNLCVVIEVEGVGAGYGWGAEEKLGRLYIINNATQPRYGSVYIKDENDAKLVAFNTLPEIFLNEIFAALQAIQPAQDSNQQ